MKLSRQLLAIPLLPLAMVLAGCAGMAQGVKTSAYRQEASPTVERTPSRGPGALVVIRYPALIHAEAETIYVSSFGVRGWP